MCKRFLTFCVLQNRIKQNLLLTFCCDMAKSRNRLIFIGAPWLRYFAKQNLWAEILQGKVCKCKSLYISHLAASSGTVCSKKAQNREQRGTFCMVSAVNSHGFSRRNHTQRCPLPSPKGTFEDAKGHKRHHQRPSLARLKTTDTFAGSCFAPGSRHSSVDTLSSFHVIAIAF